MSSPFLHAARSFDEESRVLSETFDPEARSCLERHGLLVRVPQRGRWAAEWRVSSKVRDRLARLPGGRCLEAV